jgi:hypothetical protein
MTLRNRVNLAALAVTLGGALVHGGPLGAATAAVAPAEPTHACCPQVGSVCYMNLDGVIIATPDMRPC